MRFLVPIILPMLFFMVVGCSFQCQNSYSDLPIAGKPYILAAKEKRKSIREGSGHHVPFSSGSRSFRHGK